MDVVPEVRGRVFVERKRKMDREERLSAGSRAFYLFLKSLGLVPFSVKNNKITSVSPWMKLYSVSLFTAYMLVVIINTVRYGFITKNINTLCERIVCVAWILVNSVTLLLLSTTINFKDKRILELVDRLYDQERESRKLNECDVMRKTREKYVRTSVIVNGVYLLITIIVYFLTIDPAKVHVPYLILSLTMDLWQLNGHLVFTYALLCVKYHFDFINEELERCLRLPISISDPDSSNVSIIHQEIKHKSRNDEDKFVNERVRGISELHDRLCRVVDEINDLSSLPIVNVFCESVCVMVVAPYLMYTQVKSLDDKSTRSVVVFSLTIILYGIRGIGSKCLQLFFIAHASVLACRAGNATKVILHKTWNDGVPIDIGDESESAMNKRVRIWAKYRPRSLQREVYTFSLQLAHNPLSISAYGFMTLDYAFLFTIICTVAAYFVVLIQLNPSN